jgi:hypothetical protein
MNKIFIKCFSWASLCFLIGTQAQAQVRVTCDRTALLSRQECVLRAELPGGDGLVWRWSLPGLETFNQSLTVISAAEARFSAPLTQTGGEITVVVEAEHNPSIRGECKLRVAPNPRLPPGPWGGGDALVPGSFKPSLAPFPGFGRARRIAFCDGAFSRLDRCWIVAGDTGLRVFALDGEPVRLPMTMPAGPCVAVAAPPPGPCPPGAPRLAYAMAGKEGVRIFGLGADGSPRELAAGSFGERTVGDLAMDREGSVFVAFSDDRAVWKIDAAGTAALHARIPEAGGAEEAGLLSMCLDPATGDLYVGDGAGVWRAAPGGAVSRVLKAAARRRFQPCHLALRGSWPGTPPRRKAWSRRPAAWPCSPTRCSPTGRTC